MNSKDELIDRAPWEIAADRIAEEFKDGDMIDMAWLQSALDIHKPDVLKLNRMPENEWRQAIEDMFQKHQFDWLMAMDNLRNTLLDRYQIALRNVRGKGYIRMPPAEQSEHAMKNYIKDLSTAWRKANDLLIKIRLSELDHTERQRNLEARAKMEHIRNNTMGRKLKQLGNDNKT